MAVPIVGYPDYTISPDGKVFSHKTNKYLKHSINHGGYHSVELFNEFGSKRMLVHRLVATAYLPNPNGFPQVNHINENKDDNSISNLEWCDAKYNMNFGSRLDRQLRSIDYSAENRKLIARVNGSVNAKAVAQIADGMVVN